MYDLLLNLDKDLFLLLNKVGCNGFVDRVFEQISNKYFWIPSYVLAAIVLYLQGGKKQWGLISILALGVAVGLADWISVHGFKNVFMRPRPCHSEGLVGLVQTLNGKCGGKFGFVSSHAANSFAIVGYLIQGARFQKFKWWIIGWGCLVAYSRVYLGVHYPADILCGAILGWFIGHHLFSFNTFLLNKRGL